jgi:hypothetical protein
MRTIALLIQANSSDHSIKREPVSSRFIMNPLVSISFLVLQVLSVLVGCVFFGVFLHRRKWFPIMHRKPLLSLGTFVSLSVYSVLYGLQSVFAETIPCWSRHLTSFSVIIFYNFLVVRTFLLWFKGRLAEQRFLKAKEAEGRQSWFIKHRHYVSDKYLAAFLAVAIFVFWTPSVIVSLSSRERILPAQEDTYDRATFILRCEPAGPAKMGSAIVYFSLTISWIVQGYLLWKLREIQENLRLAKELKLSCGSAVVLGLIAAIGAFANSSITLQLVSIAFVVSLHLHSFL